MKWLRLLINLLCLASLTGCSWIRPITNFFSGKKHRSGVLIVQVSPWFGGRVPVYALAYRRSHGKRGKVAATQRVKSNGNANFVVPMDHRYDVQAYADLNRNGRHDANEPMASVDDVEPLSPSASTPSPPPLQVRLPGKGVQPKPAPPGGRLNPADRARLDELLQRLPSGVHL